MLIKGVTHLTTPHTPNYRYNTFHKGLRPQGISYQYILF